MRAIEEEYDPYAGLGRSWLLTLGRCLFMGLLCGVALALFAVFQFRGLMDPVAMEQALIGRNLAEGRGFVTDVLRPIDRGLLGEASDQATGIRALWHAPGYPYLLAVLLRLIRPAHGFTGTGLLHAEVRAVVPLGIALTVLGLGGLWLVAASLFDRETARLVAIVYGLSLLPLQAAVGGGSLALSLLLGLLVTYGALQAIRSSAVADAPLRAIAWTVAAGVLAGLLVLTDYAAVALVVGIGIFLFCELQRRRGLSLFLYVLLVLLVVVPWFWANARTGGGILGAYPYGWLQETSLFPGQSLERSADPSLNAWRVAASVREGVAARYAEWISGRSLAQAGILLAFFLVALFQHEEGTRVRTLKFVLVGVLLAAPLFPGVPGSVREGWSIYFPLMALYGVGAFLAVLDREEYFDPNMRPFLTVVLVCLCALPLGMRVIRGQETLPYPPYHGPLQAYVAGLPSEGQAVVTDIPWATAWYGRRTSLLLPLHPDALAETDLTVGAIYLTGMTERSDSPEGDRLWQLMHLDAQIPEALAFRYGLFLPAGSRQQVVLLRQDPLNNDG